MALASIRILRLNNNPKLLPLPSAVHDKRPTLTNLLKFPAKERNVNVAQEISTKYIKFGTFLLEDGSGARVHAIAHKHRDDAEQINTAILREWLQGKGKQPVTWDTLIGTLKDTGLNTLASDIRVA